MVTEKSVKKLENSQIALTMTVDKETIEKAYESKIAQYKKTIEVPGFRKGHVPAAVIESKFGDAIREESTFQALEDGLKETLETLEENERPLPYSTPELQDEETLLPFKKNSDVTFTVKYDIRPEFELPKYTGNELKIPTVVVEEEDINKEIEKYREQNSMIIETSNPAQDGDVINIDYSTDANDERKDFTFTLGSGYNYYKLDSEIVGMKAGEEKSIEKTYGEADGEELNGKTIKITIKVNTVKHKELPELDDEFAQDVSAEYNTVEDMKNGIKAKLEASLAESMKNEKGNAILNKLESETDFALPASMIEEEANSHWSGFVKNSGLNESQIEMFLKMQNQTKESVIEAWKPDMIKELKKQLIMHSIQKAEKFEVTDEELEAAYGSTLKTITDEKVKSLYVDLYKDDLAFGKVLPFLLENNTFVDGDKISYSTFTSASIASSEEN